MRSGEKIHFQVFLTSVKSLSTIFNNALVGEKMIYNSYFFISRALFGISCNYSALFVVLFEKKQ